MHIISRQNSTWSLNWSIGSDSKETEQLPIAIARTSIRIINLFTIPHRIKYHKNDQENCQIVKFQKNQSSQTENISDDSKFSTTTI